jgi:hypothetical protein
LPEWSVTVDIEQNLRTYVGSRQPTARFTSFDYCFNHFQSHRLRGLADLASPAGMELSCLHLGFFLASWGMLRGSTTLSTQSIKSYAPVIEVIASFDQHIWELDAHAYTDASIELLLEVADQLRGALPRGASSTLVTKIMLGVFGCVPAFDTYFMRGFGVSRFGKAALGKVGTFYLEHADIIEANRIPTIDFASGGETNHIYTRAKVIDMIFFIEGGYRPRPASASDRD